MTPRTTPLALLLSLLLLALGAGLAAVPARAASPGAILEDCQLSPNGELRGRYSKSDLRAALRDVTGDAADYSGCSDAIRMALRARSSGTGGGGTDGGDGTDGAGGGTGGGGTGGGGTGGGGTDGAGGGTTGAAGDAGGFEPLPGDLGSGSTGDGAAAPTGDGALTADAGGAPTAPVAPQPGSAAPVQLGGATVSPSVRDAVGGRDLPAPLIGFLVLLGGGALAVATTTIGRRVLAHRGA